ncbi:hypothetical protein GBZ48_34015 [Azospirillum melinis]|uniref:Uncharacterized protein n=1 Tax=Azospirillum melinis TaxID=328839 RepID=A0ABX2KNF7_9PROT|nr:hypothetical protein [Azospirillum melinis]MBP2309433.1 hypothetical protein [Azospirillum melinis]NUB04228.1 hypothetical protein [Azospirillum melinis]
MAKLVARFIPGLTMSLALAAGVMGAGVLGGGAAQAQTVGDYTAAMAAAPITDAVAAPSVAYCQTLTNYVYTSIPENQRSSWVLPLVTLDGAQSAETSAKRDACLKVRQQALIAFDAGTGEQIVTPAEAMEGPTDRGPYYKEPSPDAPVPHTGRATPRQPMPRGGVQ